MNHLRLKSKMNSIHIEESSDVDFQLLEGFLLEISPLYPTFREWLNFTFQQGFRRLGERKILLAHNQDELAGIALLKNDEHEKKICTFYVAASFREYRVGHRLMDKSLQELDYSPEILVTVSDERHEAMAPVLTSQGFTLQKSINGLYRPNSSEHFYKT